MTLAEYAAAGRQEFAAAAPADRQTRPPARAARRAAGRRGARARLRAARDASSVARCEGATLPTWLETSLRRRLWNAPPSGTETSPAPYQLSSTTVASSPARLSAVARPAAVALVWKTRSQSAGACSGAAKSKPKRARELGARRIDVDQRHLGVGESCAAQVADQRADHAGADDRDAVAGAGRGVPDGVERGLHVGGEHRARRRHAVGQAGRRRRPGMSNAV